MTIKWLAGFFDGEGSIHLTKYYPRHKSNELRVTITQKNPRILEEIVGFLGYGKTYFGYVAATARIHFTGWKAYKFLKTLLPFLVVKQLPAKFAIQYMENKKGDRRVPSKKELRWRKMHYVLMKLYNHQFSGLPTKT